jgi:hypothetical protein
MKRFTVAVVAISGCILGPACQAIVGIESRSEAPPLDDASIDTAPDTDGSVIDADGAPPCPPGADVCTVPDPIPSAGCPTGCAAPAPAGWKGPSATYDGAHVTKPAACPSEYTSKEPETHAGMTAADALCGCGSPVVTGRVCTSTVQVFPLSECGGTPKFDGDPTTAQCIVTTLTGKSYRISNPTLVPGLCTFPGASTTRPPESFEKAQVACGLTTPTACAGNDKCITTPAPNETTFGRLCIHKDGDVACPSEDYKARIVGYKNVNDTRGCTACAATPQGGACGTNWGNRADTDTCGTKFAGGDTLLPNTCYSYSSAGKVVDIAAMTPSAGTCTPTGGAPLGKATSIEPVTYCCNF